MIVGLIGTEINNGNMGCVALTYSLLIILEKISKEKGYLNNYIIFEVNPNQERTVLLSQYLGIEINRISTVKVGRFGTVKSTLRHLALNINTINNIKLCDYIVDLTQGDSFTDIYGSWIFYSYTRIKRIVTTLNIPLILGPQTYGPFRCDKCKEYAAETIKRAFSVMTRDIISLEYLEKNGVKNAVLTTDLAFFLPYSIANRHDSKMKIGVNISGLLVKNKVENTKTEFLVNVNYDEYILEILKWLSNQKNIEIYLIPHVYEDYKAAMHIIDSYSNMIKFMSPFESPIEAKSQIAQMDVFLGSRMHATIAAFSSGVATIPVAYSRKFKGLFETLGYSHVIDLQKLSTREAIELTKRMIVNWKGLQNDVRECKEKIEYLKDKTYQAFYNVLNEIEVKKK